MHTRSFLLSLRKHKLPFHLTDDSTATIRFNSSKEVIQEFKNFHSGDALIRFHTNIVVDSPEPSLTDRSNTSRTMEASANTNGNKKFNDKFIDKIMHNYLAEEPISIKRRIKCTSLDRICLDELATSYKVEATLRDMKRICDINLNILLEDLKKVYLHKTNVLQSLCMNIGRLVTMFIFSSLSSLRSKKGKYILEKLDELENVIYNHLNIHESPKVSPTLSPIQGSGHDHSVFNFNELATKVYNPFNTKNAMGNTPRIRRKHPDRFGHIHDASDKQTYQEILKLVGKVKYTIAQLGHFMHYDRIANPTLAPIKHLGQAHQEQTSSMTQQKSQISMDLDEDRQVTDRSEIYMAEELPQAKNIQEYFYIMQKVMDDFDDNVVNKKIESLRRFCVWKAKKWSQRDIIEKKYQKMTCKICESSVKTEKFKSHIELCRKKAELKKRLKELDNKINDSIFYAFMEAKTLQKTLVVESKKYSKLKAKTSALQNQQAACDPSTPMNQGMESIKTSGKSLENTPNNFQSKTLIRSNKKDFIRRHSMQIDNKMIFRKLIPENNSGKESPISPTKISDAKGSDDSQIHKLNSESSDSSFVMCIDDKAEPSPPTTQVRKQIDVYKEPYESKPVKNESPKIERVQNRRLSVLTKAFKKLHLEEAEDLKDNNFGPKGSELEENHPLSARLPSKNGSDNSPSASDSSFGDSQNSDRSITYSTSPEGKPLTPVYRKSKFHPRNANVEDNADDESESGKFFNHPVMEKKESKVNRSPGENEDFGGLRRAKTGLEGDPSPGGSLQSKDKSFAEDGQVGQAIGQLKKLKEEMDKKKLQIELYETVQTKAKIVVNQESYTKELDIIKDDITTTISDLLDEIKNKKVREFANNFMNILLERISCGKNIEDTKKKIDQLEGKHPDEPMKSKTHERRPSFLRGNSLIFSPAKQPKNMINSKKRFTDELSSTKFSFLNKSLSMSSNRNASAPVKVDVECHANPKDFRRHDTFGDDNRILQDLDQGQNNEEESDFTNQVPDIGTIFNNEPEDKGMSWQEGNDTEIRESKDAILSLWNASISEMQDSRKQEENEGFEYMESRMSKLTQDQLRDSLPSSIANSQSIYYKGDSALINPSISILEVSPRKKSIEAPQQILKTPDFSDENKRFLFAKKEEHDSPITPTFDRSIINKSKSSTAPPLDFSGLPPTLQNPSENDNVPSIIKTSSQSDKPAIVFHHSRTDSKDKMLTFKRLDKNGNVVGQNSRPMSPTHESDNSTNKLSLKNMLGTSKLFQMLEKKEDYDMNRLPSLCPTPIGSLTKIDKESDCDDNFFTSRKSSKLFDDDDDGDTEIIHEELKENFESLSVLESPMYDREYFSDSEAQQQTKEIFKAPPMIGIKDFEPLKIISKGAFGRVWLVRKKATKDLYAMKVINLAEKLMKNTELDNLKKENSVFNLAQEDYVVRAVFTFTHETCICFVMEYMIGGDLGDFLFNYNALDEDIARFYIAEIIMAVEYLHSLGIVHRDLKPDNILLDKNGHAKLTDFGLSETGLSEKIRTKGSPEQKSPALFRERLESLKRFYAVEHGVGDQVNLKVKGKLVGKKHESREYTSEDEKDVKASDSGDKLKRKGHRLIGTPDYMAPEIISHISITSYSSDWWSVGVILFEFLVGIAPFNDESPELIYDNILNLRIPWDQIKIGEGEDCLSYNAADLIKKLLDPDHTKRLGANGAKEIKEHPFFEGIDWEAHRKQQAPIAFDQIQDTDTQNFARMYDKISEKEKADPFVLIPKSKDAKGNLQAAIQFIESAQDNFQRVNIPALYSATLQLAEETIKKKEGELKQIHDKNGIQKFNDVFEMPE